jgi:hypothetical protein
MATKSFYYFTTTTTTNHRFFMTPIIICFDIIVLFVYSPTTRSSADAIWVWNDGASADISQLYLPVAAGCTLSISRWVSLDAALWEKRKKKMMNNALCNSQLNHLIALLYFQEIELKMMKFSSFSFIFRSLQNFMLQDTGTANKRKI